MALDIRKLGVTLRSTSGTMAYAEEIYDEKRGKFQSAINDELASSIGSVNIPVTGVKTGDKVLSLTSKELSATLGLSYADGKIKLLGIGNAEISMIDVTDFIKDKFVSEATLVETAETGVSVAVPYIKLVFNDASAPIRFSVKSLVDVYTGANLKLSNNYASTTASAPAAGVTVDAAIKNLATRMGTAEGKTYVDSLGGKKGAITLASGSTTSGAVNFTIGTDNKLSATVVDTAYAKSADVASTYLSKTEASTTYETKTDAAKLATKTELGEVEAKIPVNVVNTIGGKTGAVTLKGGNTADGTVNLAISEAKEISATIVGISNFAKNSDVAAVQNTIKGVSDRVDTLEKLNLDSEILSLREDINTNKTNISANTTEIANSLNSIAKGTDGSFVTTTIGAKSSKKQTVGVAVTTHAVSTASSTANGLATAYDIYQSCIMATEVGDTTYDEWDAIVGSSTNTTSVAP